MNIISFPTKPLREVPASDLLPRPARGARHTSDLSREITIHQCLLQPSPIEALAELDLDLLRKAQREARRRLRWMEGAHANAKGWWKLLRQFGSGPFIETVRSFSEEQTQAGRESCRSYRRRVNLLRLAIQFKTASSPTTAA